MLALILVLGLRPVRYIPILPGLTGFGFLIEELQPLNGRSRDIGDGNANTIGLAVGALFGIVARFVYLAMRRELSTAAVRRRFRVDGIPHEAGRRIYASTEKSAAKG